MHKSVVANLSKSLHQLLNGDMEEAKKRCVSWDDTDEQTFIRFGQWAYTGGYKAEGPEVLLDSSQIATSAQDSLTVIKQEPTQPTAAIFQNSAQHCGRDWAVGSQGTPCVTCKTSIVSSYCSSCRCVRFTHCAKCRKRAVAAPSSPLQSMCTAFASNAEYAPPTTVRHVPRKNTESCEVYTEVFLSHAKLYVLADKYDIPVLRKLSLHSLYETLVHFTLYQDRIGDVVSLVRYSFENTIESDKLRSLLVGYCACFAKELSKGEEFQELMSECPDFAYGLVKELGRYLN